MPQFFIKDSDIKDSKATINGDECYHLIKVRRAKLGDIIDIRTDSGRKFRAEIMSISTSYPEIRFKLFGEIEDDPKIIDITLYMALLKSGNFEFVIQKSAEIGVNRIVPVHTSRTVPEIGGKIEDRHKRWNKIALNAAKQCLRYNVPSIEYASDFFDAVKNCSAAVKLAGHPGARLELKNFLTQKDKPESVSILIGPEGGFSDSELDFASEHGWSIVNFGNTSLRAETAAIVIPSLIIYQWS